MNLSGSGNRPPPIEWAATPFREVRVLGRGGMGTVYQAFDQRIGRVVAVKVLDSRSPASRARFLREGRIAASLQHPNVVLVHEILSFAGADALVCELVEDARPLDEAWRPLDLAGRVGLLRQAAAGVAAAHQAGVVHRDLKPDNVLVDAAGRARVGDFGVAYSESLERLTLSGVTVGTPSFMAPEQLAGSREVTPAADVWALGVLLYLALCDELPFSGSSYLELASQAVSGFRSAQRRLIAPAPRALRALVEEALQTEPSKRLQSAAAFEQALAAWLERPEALARWPFALAGLASALALAGALWAATPQPQGPPGPSPAPRAQEPASGAPSAAPAREAAGLADPNPLRRYRAALELTRAGPPPPARARAEETLRALRAEPLAVASFSEQERWQATLTTDLRVVGLSPAGARQTWSFEAGASGTTRLPRPGHLRTIFDAQGGAFLSSRASEAPAPGVVALAPDGSWRWEIDPELDPRPISALLRLPEGGLVLGGKAGLYLRSASGEERLLSGPEARLPQSVFAWGAQIAAFFVPPRSASEDALGSLRRFDLASGACEALCEIPGYNSLFSVSPEGSRLAIANSHYGRVALHDAAGREALVIFTPAGLGKRSGPMHGLFWGARGERLFVFYEVEGARPARLECWDATRTQTLLWSRTFGEARAVRALGPGPDFLVVGYAAEVRVFAFPEGPP